LKTINESEIIERSEDISREGLMEESKESKENGKKKKRNYSFNPKWIEPYSESYIEWVRKPKNGKSDHPGCIYCEIDLKVMAV
jgi:hypothetical protein